MRKDARFVRSLTSAELSDHPGPLGFAIGEQRGEGVTHDALEEVCRKVPDLGIELGQPGAKIRIAVLPRRHEPPDLAIELVREQLGELRREKSILQRRKRRLLDDRAADRGGVRARAALAVARATVIVPADDREPGAARAADDQAREEMPAPTSRRGAGRVDRP
nr:hypothetical protein [Sphingomonas corticis]